MFKLKNSFGNFRKVLSMYRIIWKISKAYILLFPINVLINSIAPLVLVWIPKLIIDEITDQRRPRYLIGLMLALIGANLLIKLANVLYNNYHLKKSDDVKSELSFLLQKKAMTIEYCNLERADVLEKLKNAYEIIQPTGEGFMDLRAIIYCFNTLVSNVITIAGFIAIISTLSWILFVVIFVIVIVNLFLNLYVKKQEYGIWKVGLMPVKRKLAYLQKVSTSNTYAKEIRINDLSTWLNEKMRNLTKNQLKDYFKLVPKYLMTSVASNTLRVLQEAGVYVYIGYQCFIKAISVGSFTMYVSSIMNLTQTLNSICMNLISINRAGSYLDEFLSFMRIKDSDVEREETSKDKENPEEIQCLEFRNVWFRYPGQEQYVLKNVSLRINANEKLAIVGDNGAGKTTFIKLLLRLYRPDQGEILLNGRNINELSFTEYLKNFSAVFQDFQTFALSVIDNITYGKEDASTIEEVNQILKDLNLWEKINSLPKGFDTALSKLFDPNGLELSGGEQQKIALCNAIYRKAPIIILDEPTAMLSPATEYELYKNFDQIVHTKTAVYISHRMSICRFCDHIAVFANGEVVEYGSHSELMERNELYHEMYQAQAQYYVDLQSIV